MVVFCCAVAGVSNEIESKSAAAPAAKRNFNMPISL
jgi:hypothetical protein